MDVQDWGHFQWASGLGRGEGGLVFVEANTVHCSKHSIWANRRQDRCLFGGSGMFVRERRLGGMRGKREFETAGLAHDAPTRFRFVQIVQFHPFRFTILQIRFDPFFQNSHLHTSHVQAQPPCAGSDQLQRHNSAPRPAKSPPDVILPRTQSRVSCRTPQRTLAHLPHLQLHHTHLRHLPIVTSPSSQPCTTSFCSPVSSNATVAASC